MREEEDVRVPEGLVDVSVTHEFLIGESLVSLLLLILCHNLTRYKCDWARDDFRNDELEVLDLILKHCDTLERCKEQVAKHLTIPICDPLIADLLSSLIFLKWLLHFRIR